MSVPTPIEPIHYDEPRAVQVREPENVREIHSAVYGAISVYVDTKSEADAILAAWPTMIQAAADKAGEVIAAVRAQSKSEEATT